MKLPSWFDLQSGIGCPLCGPRAKINERHFFVCKLSVSTLYLSRDQTYRGTCAVVYDPAHAARPSDLGADEWQRFTSDAWIAERAITRAFKPDHINVECLGNTVPHLHIAIIPRYRSDPRWGHPIWTTSREEMPGAMVDEAECARLACALREHITHAA